MIAKKYRLREYEISRVFKKGRPFFGTYWTMNCLEARNVSHHRMAVSISRKHDKRAVARNRYRRGLYDGLLPLLNVQCSMFNIETGTHSIPLPKTNDQKLTTKMFQCVFTLKKGLKILEKKIPQEFIDDAIKLLALHMKP